MVMMIIKDARRENGVGESRRSTTTTMIICHKHDYGIAVDKDHTDDEDRIGPQKVVDAAAADDDDAKFMMTTMLIMMKTTMKMVTFDHFFHRQIRTLHYSIILTCVSRINQIILIRTRRVSL